MYLKYYCDRTVTGLVTMLLNTFLPERYQLYAKENNKLASTITTYNANIPTYLHERPHNFVKHMLKRQDVAKTIRKSNIKCEDNSKGIFKFTSQTPGSKEEYNVNLSLPSCNCFDFRRTVWPCKHILAMFYHFNSWSWENLPKSYTNNPFISIDNDIVATKIKYSQHPNNSNTQFKNSSHEIQQDKEDIRAGDDDEDEDNENINVQLKSLPPRHRKNDIQKEQEQCRILLKEAIDFNI